MASKQPSKGPLDALSQGTPKQTADFLLRKMAGFILAMNIRWLYNYSYTPSLESVPYREEAWPSTRWAFMLIVPLAGALQLVINAILARLGWWKQGMPKEEYGDGLSLGCSSILCSMRELWNPLIFS